MSYDMDRAYIEVFQALGSSDRKLSAGRIFSGGIHLIRKQDTVRFDRTKEPLMYSIAQLIRTQEIDTSKLNFTKGSTSKGKNFDDFNKNGCVWYDQELEWTSLLVLGATESGSFFNNDFFAESFVLKRARYTLSKEYNPDKGDVGRLKRFVLRGYSDDRRTATPHRPPDMFEEFAVRRWAGTQGMIYYLCTRSQAGNTFLGSLTPENGGPYFKEGIGYYYHIPKEELKGSMDRILERIEEY